MHVLQALASLLFYAAEKQGLLDPDAVERVLDVSPAEAAVRLARGAGYEMAAAPSPSTSKLTFRADTPRHHNKDKTKTRRTKEQRRSKLRFPSLKT